MNFGLTLGKSTNTVKFIRKYVKVRAKEKQTLNNQLERLNVQHRKKEIDQHP